MQLIIGLGNPGPRYARTRHNMGFLCLEALAREHGLAFGPIRAGCMAAAGAIAGRDVVLLKPLTYMNRSGEAVAAWLRREGPEGGVAPDPDTGPPAPLAIVDDIALPLGALRLRARGSAGGHNGLASLERVLGGEGYPRLRLGVGPEGSLDPADWADYVLEDFADQERERVDDLAEYGAAAVAAFLAHGLDVAGGRFNRRRPPVAEADDSG